MHRKSRGSFADVLILFVAAVLIAGLRPLTLVWRHSVKPNRARSMRLIWTDLPPHPAICTGTVEDPCSVR